ncbi:UPF0146 family protein [Methanobacterium alcaliphilum]|uniref:UPF0146 family protein n=1 Tax=Methanobacterium alcaliphilum TaxID=392018 RepID=UPI00200AEEFE|nr:UPF0146 family protein [Methanobacterium alcaliphilum]MCK9150357.1 hypothetical protein [Methanobacterium alcaliphilum]
MWKDFTSYIINQCQPNDKVVEVGVGKFHEVACNLQRHSKMNIVITDIKPCHEGVIQDDINHPKLSIYYGASIIYSIRPPMELHQSLINLAESVGATLIIKTLTGDDINTKKKMRLVNYKKSVFYVYP